MLRKTQRLMQILFWALVLAISMASLWPIEHLPQHLFDWWDKAQHALAFFYLGLVAAWAYPQACHRAWWGILLYGGVIEIAQAMTGWRYGDWQDFFADAVGLGLAVMLYWFMRLMTVRSIKNR